MYISRKSRTLAFAFKDHSVPADWRPAEISPQDAELIIEARDEGFAYDQIAAVLGLDASQIGTIALAYAARRT